MKHIILILFLFCTLSNTKAQSNQGLWGGLEVGLGKGIAERGDSYDMTYNSNNNAQLRAIRGVLGYYITPTFSLGAGVGLTRYTNPEVNTLPIFLDLRYHPLEKIVLNANIGHSVSSAESGFSGKFMGDLSAGYRLLQLGRFDLTPSIGYNYSGYSVYMDNQAIQNRHSLFLKISLLYK